MNKIIFIDTTCNHTHKSILNKAIGASEYQFYNLIKNLSDYNFQIVCYNCTNKIQQIDNIIYKSITRDLIIDEIEITTKIVIQRWFMCKNSTMYEKIKNNKIFLWIHDLIDKINFMRPFENKQIYNDDELYKNEILCNFYLKENINYIFVSNFIEEKFIKYFKNYNLTVDKSKLNVIYNILYEDEYIDIKNQRIEIDKNYITYASAWQKGITGIVNIFDFLLKHDKNLILVLMSPGYDWSNYIKYSEELKHKFSNNIIIYGPLNKKEMSLIIKKSLVVLTPIFQETFGCVFAESYYLETPVIASNNSGAVKEIIDNDYVIDYNNKQEILKKILFLKQNRDDINVKLDKKFMFEHNINLWINLLS